jgi:hypothetical protein
MATVAVVARVGIELPCVFVLADPQPQPLHLALALRKVNEGVERIR